MSLYAIHRQAAPPSGVAFSLSARVTPSCLQGTSTSTSKIVRNLITATNDFLQLFEVVEEVVYDAGISDVAVNGLANGGQVDGQAEREQSEEKKPADLDEATQVSVRIFSDASMLHSFVASYIAMHSIDSHTVADDIACGTFFDASSACPCNEIMWNTTEEHDEWPATKHDTSSSTLCTRI